MRIGILSTFDEPLLVDLIEDFSRSGIRIECLLMDEKGWPQKDIQIYHQRTGNLIKSRSAYEADKFQIPIYLLKSHNSEASVEIIKKLSLDLILNYSTPRILGSTLLKAPKIGFLNCHPGLLPDFRGCSCVEWALFQNAPVGNTVHFMTEAIDEGAIVLKKAITLMKKDSYQSIRARIYQDAIPLFRESVLKIKNENLHPSTMEVPTGGTYFKPIDPEKMESILTRIQNGSFEWQS